MPDYLRPGSIPYAAAKLGISLPTAYKLIKQGYLRTYRIGRAHRCTDEAIATCIRTLESETAVAASAA
jgi:excisionase family DNA binding protein